ncbi:MAG: SDR family oxidoreductase [Chloroflexi bacterium]|nr:SDR family oxidoreductase [Chloroflexota bacterium]
MDLNDKVAIVTGGATGIGRGIGIVLASYGASIVVADLDADTAEKTSRELADKGVSSMAAAADVTMPDMLDKVIADALTRFTHIDILVNNAGVAGAKGWYTVPDSREEDWLVSFEVNVKGIANATNAVAPVMKNQRYGKIVNIASIAGREGRPALPHYSSSKAAVINYTWALADELAPFNINVNAVCPGLLWTPMWDQVGNRYAQFNPKYQGLASRKVFDGMVQDIIPLKREQTPEDVGQLVAFLASEDARNITGQAVNVDGGAFLR